MPIFSFMMIALVILGGILLVKKVGFTFNFLKAKQQDRRIEDLETRLEVQEKHQALLLEVILESDLLEAAEFHKKLMKASISR